MNLNLYTAQQVQGNVDIDPTFRDIAHGPLLKAVSYNMYFCNGYRFHTGAHSSDRLSDNSGVCISGGDLEYYGKISEILELEYPGLPMKHCVVLKCEWFDPTPGIGTKVHDRYGIVEINKRKRLNVYEPFILGAQATQVSYIRFPSLRRDKEDWLAVWKVKPRGWLESKKDDLEEEMPSDAFQANNVEDISIETDGIEDDIPFVVPADNEFNVEDDQLMRDDGEDVEDEEGDDEFYLDPISDDDL